jgi:uncharacterized protein
MRFVRDESSGIHLIRGYEPGEIRIDEGSLREAVILTATALSVDASLRSIADLGEAQVGRVLQLAPEVVLLGSGVRQVFPPAAFGARFLAAGIGFEVMDTAAACRTFNVLVSERRNVAAVLIL